jgi:phosphoribosylformylglycinamidine synthase
MALAGGKGIELFPYEGRLPAHAIWFGEDQGRYLMSCLPSVAEEIADRARLLALPARIVGRVGGQGLTLKGEGALPLDQLRAVHEAWLPRYMEGEIG